MIKVKNLSILLFLFGGFLACHAQEKLQIGVRFIPQATTFLYKTGVPITAILKDAPYDQRTRFSMGFGGLYYPFISDKWSIGADLVYSQQGGGYKSRITNLDYFKIPLWLGYNASPSRKLIFNFQVGIDVSLLVNAKMKYAGSESIDISSYIRKKNWGVPVAVGFKFKALKSYFINTQLFLYTDFQSLSKTNPSFGVQNYIIPGIRISIDHLIKKK
ncbi:MAG: outer membrane beta-barrel protein [Pelobium sp.]